ncbi:hypothetical protein LMG27952_03445 [Paraburkholderia hiiakae]|uniref:Uncharacterized protein n=1 Tax=Paraburkholderia hiiakae TaxID=1081782 RepID=A0ABM8NQV1_9BURK|nr:hypothetical protein [Paraburkholderia hiiakae]CAD6539070.1 hypothetical protein LMG27952_03445 [Paraburkholderia hiiakae]
MNKIERNQLANIQAAGGCCKSSGSKATVNVTVTVSAPKSPVGPV